jgi:hypothetical protein
MLFPASCAVKRPYDAPVERVHGLVELLSNYLARVDAPVGARIPMP